ncbi:MAG: hypothetical protein L3J98_05080 [Gammaproteobacteria bacterium]|nr:hypothetical protein [Gammaproteobacteria bacterium]
MNTQKDPWTEEADSPGSQKPDFDLMKNLPAILRILGAGAVLIAMYSFLIRGWDNGDDMFRYFLMLGHTGVLAAIGIASGYWLKESKGARLLLTLSLISVPANFAILGAFIFSQTAAIDISTYPHYVAWSVDSLNAALLSNGIALLVLIPVTFLGFTVLARSMSKKLSILFLLSNAALLLPLRDPQLVGLMVLVLAVVVIALSRKTSSHNAAAKTNEGIIALGLQLLPLAVLMGRSLWLYSADLFLLAVLSLAVFFILRQVSFYLGEKSRIRNVLEGFSVLSAILFGLLLIDIFQAMTSFTYGILFPFGVVASMAMIYEISYRHHCDQYRAGLYRRIAVAGLVIGMAVNLLSNAGFVVVLMTVIIGMGASLAGYKMQKSNLFSGGIILMLLGIAQQLYKLVWHFDLGNWASLAVLGIVSIIIASMMESQGSNIKLRFVAWKAKLAQWEK